MNVRKSARHQRYPCRTGIDEHISLSYPTCILKRSVDITSECQFENIILLQGQLSARTRFFSTPTDFERLNLFPLIFISGQHRPKELGYMQAVPRAA
jgi:hypothetical protein